MKPTRIAFVIEDRHASGPRRITADMANHWAREGHCVTVISFAKGAPPARDLDPAVTAVDLHVPAGGRLFNLLVLPRRVAMIRRALRKASPEIVVSRLTRANALTLVATVGLPVRVIACEGIHFPLVPWPRSFRIVWRAACRRRLDAFVVQSERTVADAARVIGNERRVHVIPNFLNTTVSWSGGGASEWSTVPVDAGRRVVAMGRLAFGKTFDLLLRAFAQASADRPEWGLLILGDGEDRASLEALAGSLGISRRVWFRGWVPDPGPTLRDSTIFALATRLEGFPNALLEAMACGLPAIASNVPTGPSDIISDGVNGLLVTPGDVDAFTAALTNLMDSPELRSRLGAEARCVRSRFSIDRVMPLWEDAIDATLARVPVQR